MKRIQSILDQDVLKPLDLNELVNIDLVPRRVPIYQEKLNRIHQDNLKAIEKVKQSIEQQNKVSRMSQPLSHHGGKHHHHQHQQQQQGEIEHKKSPLPPLQPRDMETKSNSSLSEHIIRMPSTATTNHGDISKSPMSETAINLNSPRDRQNTDPYSPVKLLQRDNAPSELARENSSLRNGGHFILFNQLSDQISMIINAHLLHHCLARYADAYHFVVDFNVHLTLLFFHMIIDMLVVADVQTFSLVF